MARYDSINPDLVSKASKLDPHRYYDDFSAKMAGFENKHSLDIARNTALTDKSGYNQMQWQKDNPRPRRRNNQLGILSDKLKDYIGNDIPAEKYQYYIENIDPNMTFKDFMTQYIAEFGAKPGETYDTPWSSKDDIYNAGLIGKRNNRINAGYGKESSLLNKRYLANVGV